MRKPLFHIVLVAPEIPPNTGTTARLCAATSTRLHLVGPLGFSLEDRHLRRAGLDYWNHVDLRTYDTWEAFEQTNRQARWFLYSAKGTRSYTTVHYQPGDFFVFGGESRGLPETLLERHPDRVCTIPMRSDGVRSLNLANAAAIVLYEGLRQLGET